MTPDALKKPRSPLQAFALEHEVDEALHKLLPCYERVLRRRFNLGTGQSARLTHRKPPPRELAALRALRRLAITPGRHR